MGSIISSSCRVLPWMYKNPYEALALACVIFLLGFGFLRRMSGFSGSSSWKGGIGELFSPEKRQVVEGEAMYTKHLTEARERDRISSGCSLATRTFFPGEVFSPAFLQSGRRIDFYNESYRIGLQGVDGLDPLEIQSMQKEALQNGIRLIQIPKNTRDISEYVKYRIWGI